jgi:hypothetical protein
VQELPLTCNSTWTQIVALIDFVGVSSDALPFWYPGLAVITCSSSFLFVIAGFRGENDKRWDCCCEKIGNCESPARCLSFFASFLGLLQLGMVLACCWWLFVSVPECLELGNFFRTGCNTWQGARDECIAGGGDLVVVDSEAKNQEATQFMKTFSDYETCQGPYPWLGASGCTAGEWTPPDAGCDAWCVQNGQSAETCDCGNGIYMDMNLCALQLRFANDIYTDANANCECQIDEAVRSQCESRMPNPPSCEWVNGIAWSYTGPNFAVDDPYLHFYTDGKWGTWGGGNTAIGICERSVGEHCVCMFVCLPRLQW